MYPYKGEGSQTARAVGTWSLAAGIARESGYHQQGIGWDVPKGHDTQSDAAE